MSHPGSPAASATALPQLPAATGQEEVEAAIVKPLLRTTISSEQLDGISSSRESRNSSPLHQTPATNTARSASSSSVSSLRRRRREDKQPQELRQASNPLSHSDSIPPGTYNENGGGDISDTEPLDGRRVRTRYGSHSNRTNLVHRQSSHGKRPIQARTSSSDTKPSYIHDTVDASLQNLVDGTLSEHDRFDSPPSPPPPPPKGDEYMQMARNRGPSQSSNTAGHDISLAQALLLEAPQTRQTNPLYSSTSARYRASSSSSGPENALPAMPGSSTPIRLSNIRQNSYALPRWQPDAEVTFCPICKTQFSFFVRKHHCRKCGRVVCNACSPHRITIPYQFIVQPPTAEPSSAASSHARPLLDASRTGSEFASLGGGERVRLCNPCVPDPNIAPPQTPSHENLRRPSHTSTHSRSASLASPTASALSIANFQRHPRDSVLRQGQNHSEIAATSSSQPHDLRIRTESGRHPSIETPSIRSRSSTSIGGQIHNLQPHRRSLVERDDSRPLPRPPRIAEEDECPVCHLELPSSALPHSDILREQHISRCIENAMNPAPVAAPAPSPAPTPPPRTASSRPHASSSSSAVAPPPIANTPEARMAARERAHAAIVMGASSPPRAIRTTRMFPYKATEKDCIDDAECTICLEEFEVGEEMARLECLCRFHLRCIRQWFELHHGQCPVHQHDGGY